VGCPLTQPCWLIFVLKLIVAISYPFLEIHKSKALEFNSPRPLGIRVNKI
jgi:hypothetical protein